MALEDYPYSFNPTVLLSASTGGPVASATVTLHAEPGGEALPVGDMQGNPLGTTLTSTDLGILPAHRTTVAQPYVDAGSEVVLRGLAQELANSLPQAQAAAADAASSEVAALSAETSAAQAATSAANSEAAVQGVIIDSSDAAVSSVINSAGSAAQLAVDGRVTVALSGAYALRGRTDAAGELIAARLDTGVNSITLGIAGDSTGNDSNDWARVWLADFIASGAHPDLRVEYGLWSDTSQSMQSPLAVLQAGTGTPAQPGQGIVSDTFARAAASLGGTTADTGQAWSGTGWSVNGSAARVEASGAVVIPAGPAGDVTVTATLTIDTTAPASGTRTIDLYSNYLNASNYLWTRIVVNSTGNVTRTLWKRIGGVNTQVAAGPTSDPGGASLGLTANAVNTVPMTISLTGRTLTTTINSGNQLQATITEADFTALGGSVGLASGSIGGIGTTLDNFTVDVPDVPYGGQLLRIYNGSHAGSVLAYARDRVAAMFPTIPDVVLINSGHNYSANSPSVYLAAVVEYVTALRAVYPAALVIASSQNPQKSPSTTVKAHTSRLTELRVKALREGWGYLPALEAFLSQPDRGDSLVQADGIHPTVGTGATGAQLWADTWQAYLDAKSFT